MSRPDQGSRTCRLLATPGSRAQEAKGWLEQAETDPPAAVRQAGACPCAARCPALPVHMSVLLQNKEAVMCINPARVLHLRESPGGAVRAVAGTQGHRDPQCGPGSSAQGRFPTYRPVPGLKDSAQGRGRWCGAHMWAHGRPESLTRTQQDPYPCHPSATTRELSRPL